MCTLTFRRTQHSSTFLQWGMSPPHPSINMVRRVSALGHSLALAPIATMIKLWLSYTLFATMSKGGHYIGYSSRTTHDSRPKYCEIAGCSVQVLHLYDGKMASLGRDVPDIGVRNIRPHQKCESAVAPPDRRYVLVLMVSMFPVPASCLVCHRRSLHAAAASGRASTRPAVRAGRAAARAHGVQPAAHAAATTAATAGAAGRNGGGGRRCRGRTQLTRLPPRPPPRKRLVTPRQ